jgi:archaellum component FlaF (FlaF/FlaG flagellin family)
MKPTTIGLLLATVFFASCSSNNKKVMVLVKGTGTVDESAKTITIKGTTGSEEKEMNFNTADKVTLQVNAVEKQTTVDIPQNGYYLLNAKMDTIIGSYQNYSAPKTTADTTSMITQDVVLKSIDSLQQLLEGKNISAANRNFYILPFTAVKITDNINATIIPPYHQMTTLEKDGDKMPEAYRFYSIKEIREKIAKQKAMTVAKPETTYGNGGKKS